MDRKSILILVICFVLLLLWGPLMNRIFPPTPLPGGTNDLAELTNQFRGATNAPRVSAQSNVQEVLPVTAAPARRTTRPDAPEQLAVLENENAFYTFTSHGGGLKQVQLKKHLEAVGSARKKNGANTNLATLNLHAPFPILDILGGAAVEGDGVFSLTNTGSSVRAEKRLTNGLVMVKEFSLSTNYLLDATVALKNTASNDLSLPPQEWTVGTATPLGPRDNNPLLVNVTGYNGVKADSVVESWFANRSFGCVPGVPRMEYPFGTNMVWAAVQNQFFAVAVIPQVPAPRMVARKIDLPAPSDMEVAADKRIVAKPVGIDAAFIYPGGELAPQQTIERRFQIYAGPKEYDTLARLGAQFGNNLDLIMGFGGFFGFFAKLLLLSMNLLHTTGLGYGLTIIVITVLIKLLFWPLTNASTKSMKRMALMQPQMKALQEKYKDDPKKMNLKLMEFMKENKISPVSGCLPMLLQIPVFFGFYRMLQSAIELRGAHFLWAQDLSTSDTVWMIPGVEFPLNPMPLLMGATMLWQARMTPPSPGMDPVQQKIMKYMPLMFMVFLYNFSAGLTLYWTVQNLLTIAQMKLTKNVNAATATPARKPAGPTPGAFGSRKSRN
jgi:YidC/Oxa1 family membrane protein insertase